MDAIEIDPQSEAAAYRESVLAPVRGLLPPEALAETAETLSGSCTVEVATFNRFVDFLVNPDLQAHYDHIIFDTAPTGHTLRLLALPGDWSNFIKKGAGDASCLGPLSGLDKHHTDYEHAVTVLGNRDETTLTLVARPEEATLAEAERSAGELAGMGIRPQVLVVNGMLPPASGDPLHERLYRAEQAIVHAIGSRHHGLAGLRTFTVPMSAEPVMGVESLTEVRPQPLMPTSTEFVTPEHATEANAFTPAQSADPVTGSTSPAPVAGALRVAMKGVAGIVEHVCETSPAPKTILAMGKGGVGKTTVAEAIAVSLADRGMNVLLATTDPASHLDLMLARNRPNLEVTNINPEREVTRYRQEVLDTKGAGLDATARAQLQEDLASPCTEEVAVFRAFSRVLDEADRRWVVLDTAPTGHTLLLLDATGSYHREFMRQSGASEDPTGHLTALTRLRDATRTVPILVTLPESTPILEALGLEEDLKRAGIVPQAWVVNQYLGLDDTVSPFLLRRAASQRRTVERLLDPAHRGEVVAYIAFA
ncbi:ArsA-related P-loop ATPase [Neoactinobaculum massilliense]|uniref:ArsA-related P-loop ATPase n=1 Tax=Neoactinobaculum massilliense TaxID=2364794 RepID=UPI0019D1AD6D|nr:ArsA-related P-loop ATPase [Neoactinobaculum massilliense]